MTLNMMSKTMVCLGSILRTVVCSVLFVASASALAGGYIGSCSKCTSYSANGSCENYTCCPTGDKYCTEDSLDAPSCTNPTNATKAHVASSTTNGINPIKTEAQNDNPAPTILRTAYAFVSCINSLNRFKKKASSSKKTPMDPITVENST